MTQPKDQANRGSALMPGEERRRSQRVIIRVPITLELTENGHPVKVAAHTVAVNIHGAMVLCSRSFEAETILNIVNDRTNQKISSRVTRTPRESPGGFLVPLEFTAPSPNFWQITFPPENWKVPEN